MWVHEAHNSTALEGNTLVLREVELLLLEGRAVGARQLADYLEVKGYADAAAGSTARRSSRLSTGLPTS
ncbi:hypothetical protein [Pengzhenrongella sp.]|uniref:hypothetical protein n=1 Tax=Pengzhenrongella sp. TaxID=2888820 RepID=UPI002F92F2CD